MIINKTNTKEIVKEARLGNNLKKNRKTKQNYLFKIKKLNKINNIYKSKKYTNEDYKEKTNPK